MRNYINILTILLIIGCSNGKSNKTKFEQFPILSTVSINDIPIDLNKKFDQNDSLTLLDTVNLKILRNEIFARKGMFFKSSDLTEYFNKYDWYAPKYHDPEDVIDLLSETDSFNISFIKQIELSKKNEYSEISKYSKKTYVIGTPIKHNNRTPKWETENKSFIINNDSVVFTIKKDLRFYYDSRVEGNDCDYNVIITPQSQKYSHLYREISGHSGNFKNIEILYGKDFICKLKNFECCGGPTYGRLYSLLNETVFLQYNENHLVRLGNNNSSEWIGFCNEVWGQEWEKYAYSTRVSMPYKDFTFIGALIYSSEISGVYESLQFYSPRNLDYKEVSINLKEFINENKFIINFSYGEITEEIIFENKRYIPKELNSELIIKKYN